MSQKKYLNLDFSETSCKKFEIVAVDQNSYVLKEKSTIIELGNTLVDWLDIFLDMNEIEYKKMVEFKAKNINFTECDYSFAKSTWTKYEFKESQLKASNDITRSFVDELGVLELIKIKKSKRNSISEKFDTESQNQTETKFLTSNFSKEKPKCKQDFTINSDYQFIGCELGYQYKWSISEKRMLKYYGQIHNASIASMSITNDKQMLYIGHFDGHMTKLNILTDKFIDLGKIHEDMIGSISITNCKENPKKNKFLFISSKSGVLKQWNIKNDYNLENMKNFGTIFEKGIASIAVTPNNKLIFVGSRDGCLKMIYIKYKFVVRDYGRIHTKNIHSMEISYDSKSQFTSGYDGGIKHFSIEVEADSFEDPENPNGLIKKIDRVHSSPINSIKLCNNDQLLWTTDWNRYVKLITTKEMEVIKSFSSTHTDIIWSITMSPDDQFLFTSDNYGNLIQWSVKDEGVLQDFSDVTSHSILYLLT